MAAAVFRHPLTGATLTREQAERYIELRREQNRRRELARLATQRDEIVANCATLHGFIREFWHILEPVAPFKTGWALEAMCACLEAVTRGDIKRLLITVPPGMMKSLLLVFWTAWEWGPKGMPHLSVLATSYSQPNVFRDNLKLRDLVTSEKFQALWPLGLRADANGVRKFINARSGFSEARPFSKMTGGRANRVKIDDPHDTENAESKKQREKTVKIMREAISDRVADPEKDVIVLIMQRLHEGDCAAIAKELGYVHLELPMEFEPDRRCRIVLRPANDEGNPAILFEDPRTTKGELLFPERFTPAAVASLKKAKGAYAWAGQYQQRPVPRAGGMFKREWFKVLGVIPAGPKSTWRAWDIGATEDGGDPTAGVRCTKVGEGEEAIYIFTDCNTGQWSPGGVEAEIKLTAAADGPDVKIFLPQDPGAAGKAYVRTLVNKLPGYAVKYQPATGSKETRAAALATSAEAGNVYILMTGDPARDAWIQPWLDEMAVFPKGTHDDQVDASADTFNQLALEVQFQWYVG